MGCLYTSDWFIPQGREGYLIGTISVSVISPWPDVRAVDDWLLFVCGFFQEAWAALLGN